MAMLKYGFYGAVALKAVKWMGGGALLKGAW